MKPGDKWEIKVPPHLAYGKERHGAIPPSSTIYFSLELVSVVPSQPLLDFFKKPTTWGMAAFASYFFVRAVQVWTADVGGRTGGGEHATIKTE